MLGYQEGRADKPLEGNWVQSASYEDSTEQDRP
jgi:hypothetical protein